jgi:hypothetical protein
MIRFRTILPAFAVGAALFLTCSAAEAHGYYRHVHYRAPAYCAPVVAAPIVTAPCPPAPVVVQAPCVPAYRPVYYHAHYRGRGHWRR